MFDDLLIRAGLAGIGVALAAAPLGCFVVWRRMAYFSDATAHAALLGVAISIALSMSVMLGVLISAVLIALFITGLSARTFAMDTLLGVIAHASLAIGLVVLALMDSVRIDLTAYLFGEILAVNLSDLAVIWGGALCVIVLLAWRWSALLISTISPDLAYAGNINPRSEQLVLSIALAVVVAVAIKVVGALLIGALLIIPAAAARHYSHTPERMVGVSIIIAILSVVCGIFFSFYLDTPTGPSIVCASAFFFTITAASRFTSYD